MFHNKNLPVKINGNVTIETQKGNEIEEVLQQNFFSSGDIWNRKRSIDNNKNFKIETTHNIYIKKERFYSTIAPSFLYSKGREDKSLREVSLSGDPKDERRLGSLDSLLSGTASDRLLAMVNHLYKRNSNLTSTMIRGGVTCETYVAIPNTPDALSIEIQAYGSRHSVDDAVSYSLLYQNSADNTHKEQSHRNTVSAQSAGALATYLLKFPQDRNHGRFNIKAQLHYNFEHNRIDERWFDALGLSSNTVAIVEEPNPENSYRRNQNSNFTGVKIESDYRLERFNSKEFKNRIYQFILSINGNLEFSTLRNEAVEFETVRRSNNFLTPTFKANYSYNSRNVLTILQLSYGVSQQEAPLSYQLRYRYNSDPLNVFLPNNNLSRASSQMATFTYSGNYRKSKKMLGVSTTWQKTTNAIAQALYYNPETGVNTWIPQNVNGNWNTNLKISYSQPLDSKREFEFSTITAHRFDNNVDYITSSNQPELSKVRNNTLTEQVNLSWQHSLLSISAGCIFQWRNAQSKRADFTTLNIFDIQPNMELVSSLPCDFELSSNFVATIRSGYTVESMNDTRYLWNLTLSKSFLHKSMTVKCTAYDLLGQTTPLTSSINAQAITETYSNTLPRYIMLSFLYRLNIQPKKK